MSAPATITLGPDHVYVMTKKEITNPMHIQKWLKSQAYYEYVAFIECLNEAVKGKPQNHPVESSQVLLALFGILEKLSQWIDEIPPIDQPQRFGNKAFRDWYARLHENAEGLLRSSFPDKFHSALHEITTYLIESMGNYTRIDYGTGHEMSFVMFLYCLFRIGALDLESMDDKVGAVTRVFETYMVLVRKLQMVYHMEPAGSHGAWSLDDFQFVPFIWGSSQMIGHPQVEPQGFTDHAVINRLSSNYMFFSCLNYTTAVKTGPFHEHSNQLWNISGAQSWSKVNQGLIKMYKAEVLAKFPVIQHTYFGSIFSVEEQPGATTAGFHPPSRPRNQVPHPPTFLHQSTPLPSPFPLDRVPAPVSAPAPAEK